MKKINKSEPTFFRKFIQKTKPANWDKINEIRLVLRKYILESEQNMQCAYCEATLLPDCSKSHIDHFKPRHFFRELTFVYNNLLVSCNSSDHCASHKDSKGKSREIFDNIINPVLEDPATFFEYHTNGKLVSVNEKAKFTEEIFNLNHPGLRHRRNNIAWAVIGYRDSMELSEVIEEIHEFESFIRYIW
ncbi:MAG: TIGR02646 family protein [Bacteroidetes bacterium]|nr:TIGR02646 family protein [Bacteroidota bacterium]